MGVGLSAGDTDKPNGGLLGGAEVAKSCWLAHSGRVKTRTILSLFLCLAVAAPASGKVKAPWPSKADIVAALEAQAEMELTSFLNEHPPGTAAGHIIPVRRVSDLVCKAPDEAASENVAVCHFVAHYWSRVVYHIATLTKVEAAWRIIGDKTVDRQVK